MLKQFDLSNYNGGILEELSSTGVLIVKCSDKFTKINNNFLDLMEKYYELPDKIKKEHVHKELHYQVGLTPEFVEMPRDYCYVALEAGAQKPSDKDPKARWFHRVTDIEENTEFHNITGNNVIPKQFNEWETTFNELGNEFMKVHDKLLSILETELNLPENYLTSLCHNGNHMIAPTFSNLNKYGTLGQILAGFHKDISFLTMHGKSRFSGLNIWTKEMEKITVNVPDGYMFIQAGRQLEYLTGGNIVAGFHEVIVNENTLKQIKNAKENNKSRIRVSSTFFTHINSDKYLEVLPQYQTEKTLTEYPKIKEGKWLQNRLKKLLK